MEGSDLSAEVSLGVERLPVPTNAHLELPSPPSTSSSISITSRSGNGVHNNKSRLVRNWPPGTTDKLRRRQAKKEILRRALTPPARRPTLRWLDFQPTPSRLRIMSTE